MYGLGISRVHQRTAPRPPPPPLPPPLKASNYGHIGHGAHPAAAAAAVAAAAAAAVAAATLIGTGGSRDGYDYSKNSRNAYDQQTVATMYGEQQQQQQQYLNVPHKRLLHRDGGGHMEGVEPNNAEHQDSDSGLEVLEESTLKPSDLIRGNHNRSMSIISGKLRMYQEILRRLGWGNPKTRVYRGGDLVANVFIFVVF
uniref:Uncharacterized protein n=1 Tax=Anopheles maculatus TaxID=74869 RepID=A0A182SXI9_9DIPT